MSEQNTSPRPIVWLGNHFFHQWLPACGYPVIYKRYTPPRPYSWEDILLFTEGEIPLAVVVADDSTPPMVLGVERFPCLTILQSVDSHIHAWHPLFAQAFDYCMVSLKDALGDFCKGLLPAERVLWMPPYCRDDQVPAMPGWQSPKEWELLFVGMVDKERSLGRFELMQRIKELIPEFHMVSGAPWYTMYPKAWLVLNECERNDLNFRVMETLGTGSCLLTPMVGHGFSELFTPDEDLFIYDPENLEAFAELVKHLLAHPERINAVAKRGQEKVLAKHLASHRAARLAQVLDSLQASGSAGQLVEARLRRAKQIHSTVLKLLYLHHAETCGIPELSARYLEAAKEQRV